MCISQTILSWLGIIVLFLILFNFGSRISFEGCVRVVHDNETLIRPTAANQPIGIEFEASCLFYEKSCPPTKSVPCSFEKKKVILGLQCKLAVYFLWFDFLLDYNTDIGYPVEKTESEF